MAAADLPPLRSIFTRRVKPLHADDPATITAKLAFLSPLSTPAHSAQAPVNIWDILPTPTPSPRTAQSAELTVSGSVSTPVSGAISASEALSDSIAIGELLGSNVPGADVQPEENFAAAGDAPVLLPTPTAGATRAPASAPVPDGIARSVRVPILMYHYLSVPPPDADIYRLDLSVTPDLFAAHLDALREAGYTAISLYDLYAHLVQGTPLPDRPVVLTFDDGYRDNYENAYPLLLERGMTATFFVVTDFIDEERPQYLTWDMAREMLQDGMSIESHGRNHVSLQGKPLDYLIWQALGSMETIEYELGSRPRFASYPAGEYDQATADVFASAGYWMGATTVQGATHNSDSLFDLTRVRVRGTTTPSELLRLMELDW